MRQTLLIPLLVLAGCKISTFPVSKPGTSREERQRDIEQCEERARGFLRGRPGTGRDKEQIHNRVVIDCLRGRGYIMSGE
jgi:hypothetical protein